MKTALLFLFCYVGLLNFGFAQNARVDFNAVDSLIGTTPEVALCKIKGKEDKRFFAKAPEKYSDFKQVFMQQVADAFTFSNRSHFFCDITVEVNCNGEAGNYDFAIEPRTFKPEDFEYFTQLIAFVNHLRTATFKPAFYLGENVNSKLRFRLLAKDGKVVMQ